MIDRSKENSLSHSRLLEVLAYDKEIGTFINKVTRGGRAVKGNSPGHTGNEGYLEICIDGYGDQAGRLAWFYCKKAWPKGEVDHEDQDPSNNRFSNLRDVSLSDNLKNRSLRIDNTSGLAGVGVEEKYEKPWYAFIQVEGKQKHLGRFKTFEKAKAVRLAAEVAFGYHPNHGKTKRKVL